VEPDETLHYTIMGMTKIDLAPGAVRAFRGKIYRYYEKHGRDLPWRRSRDPYCILVSEIMLQQTPVERVEGKYRAFTAALPDFVALARAPLRKVLAVWQGLGYNRRALALKRIAERVVREFGGQLPPSPEVLAALPGIGPATASSVAAFAFNIPVAFVETNVRAVFIHFFFGQRRMVRDEEILPLVRKTLDARRPRQWYNALMDYGAMLKSRHGNPARKSAHHRRQPSFHGSDRQLRGMILRAIVAKGAHSMRGLAEELKADPERMARCVAGLEKDGLISKKGNRFSVA